MVSDADRRSLYEALAASLGREPAATLMELLPPAGWGDLVRRGDLAASTTQLRGEMTQLRGEMAEVRGEFAGLRGEFAELRGEFGELRGEFAELRARVDSLLPRLVTANIASMIGVAALVLAAARLA